MNLLGINITGNELINFYNIYFELSMNNNLKYISFVYTCLASSHNSAHKKLKFNKTVFN